MMENHQYPFVLENNTGSIEFVATHPDYKRKGIAEKLLTAIIGQSTRFNSFVLEVADTNYSAIKLYEKMGFAAFFRKREKYNKRAGFEYYLYLRWN